MRRRPIEATLVVLWLLASGIHGYASGPRKPAHGVPPVPEVRVIIGKAAKTPAKLFARDVSGYGETVEDAEEQALAEVSRQLAAYFKEEGRPLSWEPPTKYIEDNLVKNLEKLGPSPIENVGMMREVRLRVELTRETYVDILHRDHQYVSEKRMFLVGKVLAGLVALLLAVAGYFRVEEATKGYYTLWLRLIALGFVAAVGAGIVLVS
jgi:hypothetical protein